MLNNLQRVIWKNKNILILALCFLNFASYVYANDVLGASGSLRISEWARDKNYTNEKGITTGTLWLNLKPEEINGYQINIESYLHTGNLSRKLNSEIEYRELYIQKSFGNFDFKLGRQIIIWGRADKINPTDNLSVKNMKLLMTEDDNQRLGLFANQMDYSFDNLRLILIWMPEWRPPVFPIKDTPGVLIGESKPDRPEHQFALKLDSTGENRDWSLSYFDGYNKVPDLKLISFDAMTELKFDYSRIKVLGADYAENFDKFGVRAEFAYTATEDKNGLDPMKQNSNIYMVLGFDHNLAEGLNINFQSLFRSVIDYTDPDDIADSGLRTLAFMTNLNSNQQKQNQFGYSLRPSYKLLNETLEIECTYVRWTNKGDSLLRPKISYALNDSSRLMLGGEFYNGPQDSFFGRLQDVSSGIVEFRYLF